MANSSNPDPIIKTASFKVRSKLYNLHPQVSSLKNTIGIDSQPLDFVPLTYNLEKIRRESVVSDTNSIISTAAQQDIDEVHTWLRKIRRQEHITLFDQWSFQHIRQVSTLDEEDLRRMGINFNIKYMLDEIDKLKSSTKRSCSVVKEEEEKQHVRSLSAVNRLQGESEAVISAREKFQKGLMTEEELLQVIASDAAMLAVEREAYKEEKKEEALFRKRNGSQTYTQASVIFDFEAIEDNEMSVKKGCTITDVRVVNVDWVRGYCNGLRGAVPTKYIQLDPKYKIEVLNQPGYWDVFISHTQRHGKAVAMAEKLAGSLEKLGLTVWLDVKMTQRSAAAMQEGVRNSECVIAIITGACVDNNNTNTREIENAYFSRPFCISELEWAIEAGIQIQPIIQMEDKDEIGTFLNQAPAHLKFLGNIDFISMIRSDIDHWNVGVKQIMKAMKDGKEFSNVILLTQMYAESRKRLNNGSSKNVKNVGCGNCAVQ